MVVALAALLGLSAVAGTAAVTAAASAGPAPVGASTGDAGAASPGPGTAGATPPGDAEIRDNGTYFVGQVLFTSRFGADDRVELRYANGSYVTAVVPQANGTVILGTEDLAPGEYRLVDGDRQRVEFTLERQTYALDLSEERVLNGGADTRLVVFVDSNRAGYTHLVSSPGLTAETLQSVFGQGTVTDRDGDGTAELSIANGAPSQQLIADFSGVSPGEYTLRFGVPDTGVRDELTVEVGLHPAGTATLDLDEPARVQQASGRQIGGTSTLPDGTTLQITVENAAGSTFRLTEQATVRDGRFVATFDFSDVAVGQRFTVTVEQGPVVRDRLDGEVVRRAAVGTAAAATTDSVTLNSVSLPDGGYVVVSSLDGTVLGHTELLEAGLRDGVTVPLSEPLSPGSTEVVVDVRRDDGDGVFDAEDPRYRLQGVDVRRVVAVNVSASTTTETVTPTATSTATATATSTATATATVTATDTATDGGGGDGLGFAAAFVGIGILVVVIVLLFGAAGSGDGESGGESDDTGGGD